MNGSRTTGVRLQFGNVHTRYTWACTHDGCEHCENEWAANMSDNGALALDHAQTTGHHTVIITEARTVHLCDPEG